MYKAKILFIFFVINIVLIKIKQNVTMYNSDAGAQIKTYPNNLGFVKNITYDNFVLSSIAYPVSINLFWCPGTTCPSASGSLSISNIQFLNFKGTIYLFVHYFFTILHI